MLVLTAPLTPAAADGVAVDLSPEPDAAWLAGYRHRGRPLPPSARAVLTNAEDVVFASVRRDPPPAPLAAVARGVVTDGWPGVAAASVEERYRRQRPATAVMAAVQPWGAERGRRGPEVWAPDADTGSRTRLETLEHLRVALDAEQLDSH